MRKGVMLAGLAAAWLLACGSREEDKLTRARRPRVERPEDVFGSPTPRPAAAPPPTAPPAAPTWVDAWDASRAGAQVVGSARCKGCHGPEVAAQRTHHMAGTSRALTADNRGRWLPEARLAAPYESERLPRVRRSDGGAEVVATIAPTRGPAVVPAAILFGSRSQLTPLAPWQDRRIVELGVSWYDRAGRWARTPGHDEGVIGVPHKREASEHCLFCHTTLPAWTDDRLDLPRSTFGIQCERCHGPGSTHAASALDDGPTHVFNPATLARTDQVRFCGQCHTRPATVYPPFALDHDPQLARFAGASLMLSDCFRRAPAAEVPTCTECHDPHRNIDPDRERARTLTACRRCHGAPAAQHRSVAVTATSDCIPCHMPSRPGHERPGVSYTDHWIHVAGRPPPFRDPARRDGFVRFLQAELARDPISSGLGGPLSAAAEEWRPRWPTYLDRR